MQSDKENIYKKDFESWSKLKKALNNKGSVKYMKEREIWWCSIGVNIGSEIDGKNDMYERPVLILKKHNKDIVSILPLTSSKTSSYHNFNIFYKGVESSVVLTQLKTVDMKRLSRKIGRLAKDTFSQIQNRVYMDVYKYETPHKRGISEPEGLNSTIIANDNNLSNSQNKTSHYYNAEALELHKKFGGKLETNSKVKLENREDLSRAYSPGVAAVCKKIYEEGEEGFNKNENKILGLEKASRDYTLKRNTVAIISDGSAILGIGNLGAHASIPVMEGKAAILKEFASVDAFPICLMTQDTEEIIKIIKNISPVFGGINLEDIASPKCFEIEERLRKELNIPVMHDDQWGAATVTLSALINSLKIVNKNKEEIRVVISGVGAAGVATAKLLISYGIKDIIFVDSLGIINKKRKEEGENSGKKLNKEKLELLSLTTLHNLDGGLSEAIKGGDVFIGLSKPNVLTTEMVKSMNTNPIIFALANPNPEISVEEALSCGVRIIATGRSDYPNQINNSLVFPGFWRGVLDAQYAKTYKGVDNSIFIKIAKDLAEYTEISNGGINENRILPNMFDKKVVEIVASSFK
jgi:malate dehydrogenase (oxaloacetate-decarboxylating)